MLAGIYVIRNKVNGKIYIGSSIDMRKRWHIHKYYLCSNNHNNRHLQSSWNKYGEENFELIVVETVSDKNNLIKREQYWIDKHNFNDLYNIRLNAQSNLGLKHTNETKKKMSENQLGEKNSFYSKHHTDKIKKLWSKSRTGENNPRYQCVMTDETKQKISIGNKGKILSDEQKKKISNSLKGSKNHFYGKHHTQESKDKMSMKLKGREVVNCRVVIQLDKSTNTFIAQYKSLAEASRTTKVSQGNMTLCCQGKYQHAGHFKWRYASDEVC